MLFTTDIHSSERCFKKIYNAVKYDVYKANIILINGDLTGKAIVPVLQKNKDEFVAQSLQVIGTDLVSKSYDEIHSNLRNLGCYPIRMTQEECEQISEDKSRTTSLFTRLMLDTIKDWLTRLEDLSKKTGKRFFMMPGNDDIPETGTLISSFNSVQNPEGSVVKVDGTGVEMVSLGYSNPTPWHTPRECSEEELTNRIEKTVQSATDPGHCIFNFHCPPFNSGLDTAPVLDENLTPKVTMGDLLRAPVGSTAVRQSIEKYQPLLSVHGHIHESPGEVKIGRTLCVNPGSEYQSGVLRAYIIDLEGQKIKQNIRIEA
jgi:uncharacterized protein